jgi:hypothetical protein
MGYTPLKQKFGGYVSSGLHHLVVAPWSLVLFWQVSEALQCKSFGVDDWTTVGVATDSSRFKRTG